MWDERLTTEQCRGRDHYLTEYFKQFLDAHEHVPKFSFIWHVNLAHDSVNGLVPFDDVLLRVLQDYKDKVHVPFTVQPLDWTSVQGTPSVAYCNDTFTCSCTVSGFGGRT